MQKSLLDSHSFIKRQSETLDLQQARLVQYDTKIQEQSEMIGHQQKRIDTLSKELEEIRTEYAASVTRQSNASGGTASGSTQAGSNTLPVPTWADVVSSAQMQQVDAAHQLIIGQLIDSTVANKPGPEPILLAPPQKVGFFRDFTAMEVQHGAALLYVVGLKSIQYSRLRRHLKDLGFPVNEIYNMAKISEVAHEFLVNTTFASFIAMRFTQIGARMLTSFKMDGPKSTIKQIIWNSSRVDRVAHESPVLKAQQFYAAWY
ncbi:hypothetical protein HK100_010608, partial [Physocladia obscura]